jgi:ribonuclease HI
MDDLAAIEGEIAKLRALKNDLYHRIGELDAAELRLQTRRNRLSPLCRLPVDIIRLILDIVVHSQHKIPSTSTHEGIHNIYGEPVVWLRVVNVCAYIRSIAIASPNLWSHIDLFKNLNWNSLCISRAGEACLSIIYNDYNQLVDNCSKRYDLLKSLFPQGQHMIIRSRNYDIDIDLQEILRTSAKNLRSLTWITYSSRRDTHVSHTFLGDGSAQNGGVGASAVLVRTNKHGETQYTRTSKVYLGSSRFYTVHSAEAAGLLMAVHLLRTEPNLPAEVSAGVDNQAVIKGLKRYRHARGQWAVDFLRDDIDELTRDTGTVLTVRWTPGHVGIDGNELADVVAKQAAAGSSSPDDELPIPLRFFIPRSFAAVQQAYEEQVKKRAKARWARSKRCNRAKKIDPTMPSRAYLKLIQHRPRWQSALLIRLRTGHAQLNADLHRIGAVDDPTCEDCEIEDETVKHYLLDCPAHEDARRPLRAKFGRRKAGDIRFLLTSPEARPLLMDFVDATGRYMGTLGRVAEHKREPRWKDEDGNA